MGLVDQDQMVKAFTADRSDDAFHVAILPRRSKCNGVIANAHGADAAIEDSTKLRIVAAHQNLGRGLPGESFGQLLGKAWPKAGRIEPDEVYGRDRRFLEGTTGQMWGCR